VIFFRFLLLFFISQTLLAQEKRLGIQNLQVINAGEKFVVSGIKVESNTCFFKIYKINSKLAIEDSVEVLLKNTKPDQLLPISSDTLHGTLNYTIQKKEAKNKATVLRFDKQLKLLCLAEQIDIARVNSFTNFQLDRYVYKSHLFLIKTTPDSSGGKQFFLLDYQLKDIAKPFEYQLKWQFAFERKYIQSAHLFYADSQQVMLFVNVRNGAKKGQWVLRVNIKNGFLIRGTRINSKSEEATYQFSDHFLNRKTKDILLCGQRLDNTTKNPTLTANKAEVFLLKLDSMGNMVSRSTQVINLVTAKVGKTNLKTELKQYALQMRFVEQEKTGDLKWWCHLYQVLPTTWLYMDSHPLTTASLGDDYTFDTKQFLIQPMLSTYFWSSDKLNTNGILSADSVSGNDGLYFNGREQQFLKSVQTNELEEKTIVLKKVDTKKQVKQLQKMTWDGKALKSSLLKEMKTNDFIEVLHLNTFLVLIREEEGNCILSVN
jgi:hypothetical protein